MPQTKEDLFCNNCHIFYKQAKAHPTSKRHLASLELQKRIREEIQYEQDVMRAIQQRLDEKAASNQRKALKEQEEEEKI